MKFWLWQDKTWGSVQHQAADEHHTNDLQLELACETVARCRAWYEG